MYVIRKRFLFFVFCFLINSVHGGELGSDSIDEAIEPISVTLDILNDNGALYAIVAFTNLKEQSYYLNKDYIGLSKKPKTQQFYIYEKGKTLNDALKYQGIQVKSGVKKEDLTVRIKPYETLIGKFNLLPSYNFDNNKEYEIFYWSSNGYNEKIIRLESNKVSFRFKKR